ncbi:fic family toxin-antitoxin system, toxin component [Actinacidiphila glaucinigra]|uniref:fic family toxin-antitoxin system, toxin component n=1 Tax=Actinacidiphila glaucinigra TaxID=235986 RepID=UPI0029B400C4|nr:fic family toxin-antitoxin system, toxin component [Actinacidiphila glaucinigra]MDX2852384.1 fic family toxin-antitoxin system, toxin component [Streptomyces sp. PA03-3a]
MIHRIDVPFLLHAAEQIDGDPQVHELGPLYAAVARVQASAMERDVYGSVYLKAAALLHTLARLPSLEHSNLQFAWVSTVGFLTLQGHSLDYQPKVAAALVRDVEAGKVIVEEIAVTLRGWTVR